MDIGSAAYTEFKWDDKALLRFYNEDKSRLKMMKMQIHSHHNMSAFFSGTDMDELHENAPNHNIYISLIVNNIGKYVAKAAYIGKVKSTIVIDESIAYRNLLGKWMNNPNRITKEVEEDKLFIIDLDVIKFSKDIEVDTEIDSRIDELTKRKTTTTIIKGKDIVGIDPWEKKIQKEEKHSSAFKSVLAQSEKQTSLFAARILLNDDKTKVDFPTACEMIDSHIAQGNTLTSDHVESSIFKISSIYEGIFKDDVEQEYLFEQILEVIDTMEDYQIVYPFLHNFITMLTFFADALLEGDDEEEIEIGDSVTYKVGEEFKKAFVTNVTPKYIHVLRGKHTILINREDVTKVHKTQKYIS